MFVVENEDGKFGGFRKWILLGFVDIFLGNSVVMQFFLGMKVVGNIIFINWVEDVNESYFR